MPPTSGGSIRRPTRSHERRAVERPSPSAIALRTVSSTAILSLAIVVSLRVVGCYAKKLDHLIPPGPQAIGIGITAYLVIGAKAS